MICADHQLSSMDEHLAVLYRTAKTAAPDAVAFKKETNREWRKRQQCTDRDCLLAWYQRRTGQLESVLNLAQARETKPEPVSPPPPPAVTPVADDSLSPSGFIGLLSDCYS
jgi:uncharacterized protein